MGFICVKQRMHKRYEGRTRRLQPDFNAASIQHRTEQQKKAPDKADVRRCNGDVTLRLILHSLMGSLRRALAGQSCQQSGSQQP
eukprot:m.354153 g.354153  ORF g.354153 m.354153 type:complete len:84 (+) comp16940_c0_seq1:1289-1540(+)